MPASAPGVRAALLQRSLLAVLTVLLALLPVAFLLSGASRFELVKLTLLRVLLAAAAGLLTTAVLGAARGPAWRRSPLDPAILAWVAWVLVKTIDAPSPIVSWRGEYGSFGGAVTELQYALLFFVVLQVVESREQACLLLRAFGCAAVAASLYAVFQEAGAGVLLPSRFSIGAPGVFGSMGNPDSLAGLAAMALPVTIVRISEALLRPDRAAFRFEWTGRAAALVLWAVAIPHLGADGSSPLFREGGPAAAKALIAFFVISLALQLATALRGALRVATIAGLLTDAVILTAAIAFSGTRAGLVGLAGVATTLVMLVLRRRSFETGSGSSRQFLAFGGAAVVLFAALGFALHAGSKAREAHAPAFLASRMEIWKPAVEVWRESPLTGAGTDAFRNAASVHLGRRFATTFGEGTAAITALSEPLQILATLGLAGLVLRAWLLISVFRQLRTRFRSTGGDDDRWCYVTGLTGVLVAYLGYGIVGSGVIALQAVFWCALALLFAGEPRFVTRLRERPWRTPLAAAAGVIVAVALALPALRTFAADQHAGRAVVVLNPSATVGSKETAAVLTEALSHANRAIELAPDEPRYRAARGAIHERFLLHLPAGARWREHFEAARRDFTAALALAPRDAFAHANLGRLHARAARVMVSAQAMAEREYRTALRLAPAEPQFYRALAVLYARRGATRPLQELRESAAQHTDAVFGPPLGS